MAETEVYGLISEFSWLRQSLVADFEQAVYVLKPYDKRIITLSAQRRTTGNGGGKTSSDLLEFVKEGIVLIEVDDMLEGGSKVNLGTDGSPL